MIDLGGELGLFWYSAQNYNDFTLSALKELNTTRIDAPESVSRRPETIWRIATPPLQSKAAAAAFMNSTASRRE